MSKSQRLKNVLDRAKAKEKKYDWINAANLYEQALRAVGKKDLLRKGEIQEKVGCCFYRSAFQAESQEGFKRYMGLSVEAYGEAAEQFERAGDSNKQAQISLCRARAAHSKSWLAENPTDRTVLLDECRTLAKAAANVYDETGDHVGKGEVCNELLTCLFERLHLVWDWQERRNIVEEARGYGEKAIEAFSALSDESELARAYCLLSLHFMHMVSVCEEVETQKEIVQKVGTYAQKALEISEKTEDTYLIVMSSLANGLNALHWTGDIEARRKHAERALELSTRTRDNLAKAMARSLLAWSIVFESETEDDPDEYKNMLNKAIQDANEAIACCQLISFPSTDPHHARIEARSYLARSETDLRKRRALLEKAVAVGRKDLEQAKRLGLPFMMYDVLHPLSKALYFLSTEETNASEKRKLLDEASQLREQCINILRRILPFSNWGMGLGYNYSALIKAELAKIEAVNQKKVSLLREAVANMDACLKFCGVHVKAFHHVEQAQFLARYGDWFGDILNQLYFLTGEKRHLEKAVRVYEDVIQAWGKANLHSCVGEVSWKMAKAYGYLAEHFQAARTFESASEEYGLAAEKIPQLRAFFRDHATYMNAWSQIESAKQHHAEKQYGKARERYEKAADLHKATARWKYLSPNYLAWARLEEAEDLSRREQTEEARDLFQRAAQLFAEAKESIEATLEKVEAQEERVMATEIAKASDARVEYCLGRTALEEAKILDRQGDHATSSRKYGSAARRFEKATETMERELDRREMRPIGDLCRAWQKMTQAEAQASPDLYLEASKLFEEAKEHSLDEKATLLALGHSSFCKALEAGTRFEAARDTSLHALATQHLEAAASYYLRAGFKSASEYAEATQKLLDAYLYMHNAKVETDPTKKARFYMITEKVLQASAGSYLKAKHPEKQEQVSRLLEKVKQERELALSLTEVLHAPLATSTTKTFTTPTPRKETPTGLERFEHADVQANLILRVKEVKVGEDVRLAIELVNAGKAPALLIKVDEVVPEGFEIKNVPEMYTFEDSYVNMKGKRLNPLKTEDVRIVVNPRSKGTFIVKPRVLYIDETGKYKSHEPDPVTITVKELGIKGWIKGER